MAKLSSFKLWSGKEWGIFGREVFFWARRGGGLWKTSDFLLHVDLKRGLLETGEGGAFKKMFVSLPELPNMIRDEKIIVQYYPLKINFTSKHLLHFLNTFHILILISYFVAVLKCCF